MNLKTYMKIAGLSQDQLAKKAGVDPSLISRLVRGRRKRVSYDNVVRIARALNLEPEELIPVPGVTKAGAERVA